MDTPPPPPPPAAVAGFEDVLAPVGDVGCACACALALRVAAPRTPMVDAVVPDALRKVLLRMRDGFCEERNQAHGVQRKGANGRGVDRISRKKS